MKLTKVFTSFLIILLNFTMFNTAHATSIADSGWNITSSIVNGATTTFNATKNKIINGASVAVSGVAKITPTGPQVGKFILKTGLTLAVTVALDELVNGVDYVLDPANNSIIYKPKSTLNTVCLSDGSNCQSSQYLFYSNGKYYVSSDVACSALMSEFSGSSYKLSGSSCTVRDSSGNFVVSNTSSKVVNPSYDPNAIPDDKPKSIPVDVVGSRIVSDAATQEDARVYTNSVANTVTATNEDDQVIPARVLTDQLENTATYPSETTAETKTETKTNEDGTTTQESTTDLPAACSWMPSVCEFASKAINFMNSDSVDSDSVETPERELDSKSFNPNMYASSSQCPADKTLSMNIVGRSYSKTFSFSDICRELSSLSNLVMAAAYAYGAIIIGRDA